MKEFRLVRISGKRRMSVASSMEKLRAKRLITVLTRTTSTSTAHAE